MKINYPLILLLVLVSFSQAQTSKIDSLKLILKEKYSKEERIAILEPLNTLLISQSFLEKSLPYFTEMVSISKELGNFELEKKGYLYISETYMKTMDSVRSVAFAYKALEIDEKQNNLKGYLKSINQLGRVYHHFQNYEKAIETYKVGIDKFNESDVKKPFLALSLLYSNLSNAYGKLGKTQKRIDALFRGVEIAEKINDPTQKSYGLYVLGYVYMELENYPKAETYFLKSLTFSDSVSLEEFVYMNHRGLGINYSRWGKYEKALEHNKKALDFYRAQGDKLYEFDVLNNTAIVYARMNDNKQALEYGKLTLKVAKEINNKLAINGAKLTISNAYLNLNQYNLAEKYLLDAAKDTVNRKIVSRDSKASIYSNLAFVYEGKKEYKKGLEFHKKFKNINDSIQKEKLDSKFTDIETKYQTEKKEKENLQLKADNAEQTLLAQKANTKSWLLGIGLLAVALIAFFIWRRYKSEAKAKQIISQQKDEIEQQKNLVETLQKELHHRMKNNLSFIDLFINLAKAKFPDKAYQTKLNELQNRMRSMFEVHKQLFKKDDITSVKAKNYIDILVQNVKEAYSDQNIIISNKTDSDETILANTSFPIGLIVNEFVTNSFKYAFDDSDKGIIDVSLTSDKDNYQLSLKDNGKGLPTNFNIEDLDSFGMETIQLLTQEYKGTFKLDGSNGVKMNITLPKIAA